jgi:monoamine oxidase
VPNARSLDARQWTLVRRDGRHRDRPLADWSIGDALASVLSSGAHRLVTDAFGYDSGLRAQNAADAIPYLLGSGDPHAVSLTPVDGMDCIPRELAARFELRGGSVFLGRELVAVEPPTDPTSLHQLTFGDGSTVSARRVVLALPKPALLILSARCPVLAKPEVRRLLDSVDAWQAAKLYLWYDRAWWRTDGFGGTRTTTDLAPRKVFYFDAGGDGSSLLLAVYTDGRDVEPWLDLADGAPPGAPATSAMIEQVGRHLEVIHPGVDIPPPSGSAFVHWGADPHETGWHYWRAGARSADVIQGMSRPDPDLEFYICGEAYSRSQAWVEGAIETAAAVVNELVGLPT